MGLVFSNIPELEDTDTETVLSNLSQLEIELCETLEKRLAHLSELAHAIIHDGEDVEIIKSIILSVRSDGEVDNDDVLPENLSELRSIFSGISLIERLIIFKRIFELLPNEKYSFSNVGTYCTPNASGKIAYIKNSFNDLAFDRFSSLLTDAKASYFDSSAEVCASLSDGTSQFCIFPIEASGDGKLKSFYDLVLKYNFKINAEFDLFAANGESFTRYALLSRHTVAQGQKSNIKGPRYLQIAYNDTESISLCELITSAEFFGLKLESVEITSRSSALGHTVFAEFKASDADIAAFMTYLSVDCPEHLLMGIYQRI